MKSGALDFVSPQIYRKDAASYMRELDKQLEAMGGDGARLVPGIDITNSDAEELIRMIELGRERHLPGVVIWYHGGLVQQDVYSRLRETVFSDPAALPWK